MYLNENNYQKNCILKLFEFELNTKFDADIVIKWTILLFNDYFHGSKGADVKYLDPVLDRF